MKERSEKSRDYAKAVMDIYLSLIPKMSLLKPLMFDAELAKRLSGPLLPLGRQTLITTLYVDAALTAAGLAFDRDSRTASVYNMMQALNDTALQDYLKSRFESSGLTLFDFSSLDEAQAARLRDRLHQEERAGRADLFEEQYEELLRRHDALTSAAFSDRLRKLRDKVAAHKEMMLDQGTRRLVTVEELGVLVGDLGNLVRDLEPIILLIILLVRLESYSLDAFKKTADEIGQAFWWLGEKVSSGETI